MLRELLDLFLTFVRIGGLTFGGGYAMLPMLQREVVENKGWATDEELTDYFAIGQCTPGVIAVNTATFIGQKKLGIPGGITATLGVIFPSLIIITALAGVIAKLSHLAVVQHAFAGIRVCVCVLIVQAVLRLWNKSVVDKTTLILYLGVFLMTALSGVLPLAIPAAVLVIISGMLGVIIGGFRDKNKDKDKSSK
jgi:chromate transporter